MPITKNRAFLLCAGYAILIAVVTGVTALGPEDGKPVLVVASPFEKNSSYRVIAKSDGARVYASLGYSWALVAAAQSQPTKALVDDLYSSGALLVLNARPVIACARLIGAVEL